MQDTYYNGMLESLIHSLRGLVTKYKDMVEYQTIDKKTWDKLDTYLDPLNEYNKDKTRTEVMNYFSKELYPILKSAELVKFSTFDKKIAIKIDSFDLRMLLDKCETLMKR